MAKKTPEKLSHDDRRKRRAQIARFVRRHRKQGRAAFGLAAREFDVSTMLVRQACDEHGVKVAKAGAGK